MEGVGEGKGGWPSVKTDETPAQQRTYRGDSNCEWSGNVKMELALHDFTERSVTTSSALLPPANEQALKALTPSDFLASLFTRKFRSGVVEDRLLVNDDPPPLTANGCCYLGIIGI